MVLYKPENKIFSSRKELKVYLGGTNAFNRALKNKELEFLND